MDIVFLHGLGQGPDSWDAVLAALDLPARLHTPDLTAWAADGAEFWALYQHLEQLCAPLEGPVILCGLSLGGLLALEFAKANPERVAALTLIGVPATVPKGLLRVQNALFRLLPKKAFAGGGLDKRAAIALCRSMAELEPDRGVERVACPALALCGAGDRANRRSAARLAEALHRGEFRLLPGAGHEVNRETPAALAQTLRRFLLEQA